MLKFCRRVFQWKPSVSIPFFVGLGISTVYVSPSLPGTIDLGPVFILAYIFFGASFLWSVGYWLTSDELRKKNPAGWNRQRKKQGGKRAERVYQLWKYGTLLAICILFVGAFLFVNYFKEKMELARPEGWLVPASDPTPDAGPCGAPPPNALTVYFGFEAIIAQHFPHSVIRVNGKDFFTVFKTDSGRVAVPVDILGPDHKLIARIERNHFTVNVSNAFRKQRPDGHSLVIEDLYGKQVLSVRYLNPRALRIKALLWLPGIPASVGPWDATEDKITGCMGDGARIDIYGNRAIQ